MNRNVYLSNNNSANKSDVSYKRKPFEFCSEKRARIANEMKEAFNFSHGGIKKKHKKKKWGWMYENDYYWT